MKQAGILLSVTFLFTVVDMFLSFCGISAFPSMSHQRLIYQSCTIFWYAHVCVSIFRQANTYTKLFLELGIVVGTQILNMLQECLLVDRPDRREEEHLEGEINAANNVTICYFLRSYFSFSIC